MALPNSDISVAMVRDELGAATNDVGRLCTHPNINMWSKWKPVRYGSVEPITEGQLTSTDFGISLPTYDSVEDLANALQFLPIPGNDSNLPTWDYLKPTGGLSQPFRLTDFTSYKHDAAKPYALFNVTSRASLDGGSSIITGSIGRVMPSEGQLTLEDFDWGDRRLAMAYRKGARGAIETVVGNAGSYSVSLDVAQKSLTVGNYYAFLFLTNSAGGVDQGILGLDGHPNAVIGNLLQFEVVTNTVTVNVRAQINEFDSSLINIRVTVDNKTGLPITLTGAEIQLRSAESEWIDAMLQYEQRISLGDITASNGMSTVYNQSISYNEEAFPFWKIFWRNGGLYPNFYMINILSPLED